MSVYVRIFVQRLQCQHISTRREACSANKHAWKAKVGMWAKVGAKAMAAIQTTKKTEEEMAIYTKVDIQVDVKNKEMEIATLTDAKIEQKADLG